MKSLLPAILAGCAVIQSSFAQDSKDLAAPEVVVTATRFEDRISDLPVNVQVIDAERILKSGARSLPELLGQEAGIYTRNSSGNPNRQIDMRGFGMTGDQNTLILVDGQRISENEQTSANLTGIPLASIERIEIVRGSSGAVLYGAGATGGTINIVTKGPLAGQKQAYIRGGAGNYGTRSLGAGGALAGDKVGLSLDLDRFDSDNYRENNEVNQNNATLAARYFGARGPVTLKVIHSEQDLRLPGARTEAELETDRRGATTPDDYSSLDSDSVLLTTTQSLSFGQLGLDVAYRERRSVGWFFGAFPGTIDTRGRVTTVSPRIKLPLQVFGRSNALVVGVDWEDWDYDSTSVFFGFPSNAVSTQENRAVYFKDTLSLAEATTLSVGAREQRIDNRVEDPFAPVAVQTQKKTLHAYDVALRQGLGERWGIYGRAGRSFRLANVNDNASIELLEPQTSNDQEIGVDFATGTASFRIAAYRMRLNNEIHFLPAAVLPPAGGNINLPPTERRGLEADAAYAFNDSLSLQANYTLASAEFREGSFGGQDVTGKTVPLVPRHRANAMLTWKFFEGASISGRVSYVGEQYFDNDQSNTFGRKMPDYTVTDLVATYSLRNWRFVASVYNAFDEKYFTYANAVGTSFNAYPEAERSYLLTAEYRFGR